MPRSQRLAVERLVAAWRKTPPETARDYYQRKFDERAPLLLQLIKTSRSLKHQDFNPFLDCGVVSLERHTRDFLAMMLDTGRSHGLGKRVLEMILAEGARASKRANRAVAMFRTAWNDRPFDVRTEVPMAQARPDVVVSGEGFLLVIEVKRRFGFETIIGGEAQTLRLSRSAHGYAVEERIPAAAVLTIFLTPDGVRAYDSTVISVSCEKLFHRLDETIARARKLPG